MVLGRFNTLHLPARVENWAARNITVRGNEMLFLFTAILCNTLHDNNEVTHEVCKKMWRSWVWVCDRFKRHPESNFQNILRKNMLRNCVFSSF